MTAVRVIDSHTEGEPTRLIVEGGPPLGDGSMAERRHRFATEFDDFRRFAILEPRGGDALVGALLVEPEDASCAAGLIFFNNVGFLGMCGHALIGAAVTLAHMGRLAPGSHGFETPVGRVSVELEDRHSASIENVGSHRHRKGVEVEVEGRPIVGDIAWGGNWFFLADAPHPLIEANVPALTRAAQATRAALRENGITGEDGAEVDHVEFFGAPESLDARSRNFVLCPGDAYDRSPCGTGTSAKLACLAADDKLAPGEVWVQESIVGSRFHASYRRGEGGRILPRIAGRAFVCAESILLRDPSDPFKSGIPRRRPCSATGAG